MLMRAMDGNAGHVVGICHKSKLPHQGIRRCTIASCPGLIPLLNCCWEAFLVGRIEPQIRFREADARPERRGTTKLSECMLFSER